MFDANIPGRMIVDSSPEAAMSRSMSACSTAIGFGCWKKGCGGLVRRREKDDSSRVGCEALDDRRSRRRRDGPDEEDGTDAAQCCVERFGRGEVTGDDLDLRRQRRRRLGAMREGADRHARVHEQVDHRAPDPPGRSGDEHRSALASVS